VRDRGPARRVRRAVISTRTVRSTLAAALLALGLAVAPADAALTWAYGTSKYSQGRQFYDCSGFGNNVQHQVAFTVDADAGFPKVGDRYWIRAQGGVVGISCSGGVSDWTSELILPNDTALAIDPSSTDPNHKIRCFYLSRDGVTTEVTDKVYTSVSGSKLPWCKSSETPRRGSYGYQLSYVQIPAGAAYWVQVPVVSFRRLAGMGEPGTASKTVGAFSSGINSFVAPEQWVTVFDRPTTIEYPAQHVSAVGDTTATTHAVLNSWYRKGNVHVDLDKDADGTWDSTAGPFAIDGQHPQYTVGQGWTALAPGTRYAHRLRFTDDKGVMTSGAAKTFTTTGTATPPGGGGEAPGGGTGGGTVGGKPAGTSRVTVRR
jgi:hypothetical protein